MEEYLLRWQSKFGESAEFIFSIGKRYGRTYLFLELKGEQFNPLETDDEEMDWSNRILSNLGLRPSYSYSHGINRVRLELGQRKNNIFLGILTAIVLAVVFGIVGRLVLPTETVNAIATDYLSLISDKFFGLLRMIAGPIVFLSVICGISGIEDTAMLGKFGKKVIISFIAVTMLFALACGVIMPMVFSIPFADKTEGGDQLFQIIKMLADILPDNIVNPFLTGNSMQIIVLAVAGGIAIMLFGKQTAELFCVINELNLVVQKIMKWISSLTPFLIFTVILENIWSDTGKMLVTAWQPLLLFVITLFAGVMLYLIYAAVRLRINPAVLIRIVAPAAMIGLTTASSSAAYGELTSCCVNKFGIDEKATRFSIPFGMLFCMVGCASELTINAMYAIKMFDVNISLITLIISVIITTMLSVTAPPVPGGLMACYTILFAHFGIPDEALAVAMTLSVFMDFADTAANVSLIPPIIAVSADKLGMVDKKVLLNNSRK